MSEPVSKKPKMDETIDSFIDKIEKSNANLQVVMDEDYNKPIPLDNFHVGNVKDMKEMSKVIKILNERLPLKEFQHLKRARQSKVLLCPTSFLNTDNTQHNSRTIQDFIEQDIYELKDSFEYFTEINIPCQPPKLKRQHKEYNKIWPCNFHPDKYLEKLFSGEFFVSNEIKTHRCYMSIAFEAAIFYLNTIRKNVELSDILLNNINAAVVVDPKNQSVVAVASDNRQNHPIQHSAMLAIDNVAKTQNGGAWDSAADIEHVNLRGIDKNLLLHLKNKFPDVKFSARAYIKKEDIDENSLVASESPYLCTGYYVYLIREPCIMCAMGLVHARAKRVFFCLRNEHQGALISKTKLQCVPSLNHHFEVFTGFL